MPARMTPPLSAKSQLVDDLDRVVVAVPHGDASCAASAFDASAGCTPSMVNAAVGTRSSSVCDPHTLTPLIDCSPSSRWENTSASAAADVIHAFLDEEAGRRLDAGDALEVGHAGLQLGRARGRSPGEP